MIKDGLPKLLSLITFKEFIKILGLKTVTAALADLLKMTCQERVGVLVCYVYTLAKQTRHC